VVALAPQCLRLHHADLPDSVEDGDFRATNADDDTELVRSKLTHAITRRCSQSLAHPVQSRRVQNMHALMSSHR
jgi:hypothetical protein